MKRIGIILAMIRFEHTVFALPFAVMSAFLAAGGLPEWGTLGWIVGAMVGARSCAMAFNRLADAKIDAANPRTQRRALPAGLIGVRSVQLFTAASAAWFIFCAWRLNPLAFALSPLALAVVMLYSYSKRFTSLSHAWLGVSLSIAPVGAWIAVLGRFDLLPLALALAVALWVAGFDIIYSCQDVNFDKTHGLYSVPSRLGIRGALLLSRALHALMMLVLLSVPRLASGHGVDLGWAYWGGCAAVGGLLLYEHSLVKPHDLSRVNAAFFTMNGLVSLALMSVCSLDVVW